MHVAFVPSLAFARECLSPALWAEIQPLLRDHWREVAFYDDIPLSVAVDVYEASEAAGILRIYTVRDANTALCGYAIFFVRLAPHYADSIQAAEDVIYVDPVYRGGTGYKFIAWCDEQLAAEGVQCVSHHVKLAHDWGKLLERQGYEPVETLWVKRLDVATVAPKVSEIAAKHSHARDRIAPVRRRGDLVGAHE